MSKNIFDGFDFEEYAALLQSAADDGLHIVHNFDQDYPMGGFSFVWARESEFKKARMIRVAVAFCSPKDQFCRKIGSYHALVNWYSGNSIALPVGDEDSAVIVYRLRKLFSKAEYSRIDPFF